MFRLAYQWRVLIVVIPGYFMVVLDTTIVNIALPRIMTTFSVDERGLVYIVDRANTGPHIVELTGTARDIANWR